MPFKQELTANIAIIGIGNILFKDEGLGIYATEYLKQNYQFSPNVDLIDGGTLGMNLIHYYQSYEQVILLDTISVESSTKGQFKDAAEPGAVYSLDSETLQGLGAYRKTAHEVEVLQTLELAALTGETAKIQVIAMVPEDIQTVAIQLSQTVEQAMPLMIQTTIEYLEFLGVEVKANSKPVSLIQIEQSYRFQHAPSCA